MGVQERDFTHSKQKVEALSESLAEMQHQLRFANDELAEKRMLISDAIKEKSRFRYILYMYATCMRMYYICMCICECMRVNDACQSLMLFGKISACGVCICICTYVKHVNVSVYAHVYMYETRVLTFDAHTHTHTHTFRKRAAFDMYIRIIICTYTGTFRGGCS